MNIETYLQLKLRTVCFSKDHCPVFKELNDSVTADCTIK